MTKSYHISEAVERLHQLVRVNVQANWQYSSTDLKAAPTKQSEFSNWLVRSLNDKGHIAWSAGRQTIWLCQQFVVPHDLQGYPLTGLDLRLVLTWWAEDAKIFVNGQLVQEGDLFDSSTRVLLSSSVTPGEVIVVALRLVSPGHDNGALMRSLLLYESTSEPLEQVTQSNPKSIDPGFVADELAILQQYLTTFSPATLDILAAAVAEIDWTALSDGKRFERSLFALRQNILQSQIPNLTSQIGLLGHAHLDMAWLWPASETWEVAVRTFESVLKLQQEFPKLTFCHSTPALYDWIEQHRPDLFAAIQQQVLDGRWEIVGGMWIEPDLNLINGESIVRQILYGQRYVLEKFGQLTSVAWLPDTFGFCWQLPQLLKQGGIEYFVTQKLLWNDTTKFPYGAFWWRSPDGTQIFSFMSNPIGEGIDPLKVAAYAGDWETQTKLSNSLWLFGVGDHGGGPTRDMLEVAERWQKSPFFPNLEFTTAHAYLQQIREEGERGRGGEGERGREGAKEKNATWSKPNSQFPIPNSQFPVWDDELYLEFHRGCYTTHADQKRFQRRCEGLLYEAELFAALATISSNTAYPKLELEDTWKKALFNQFHDILPGTSIPEVFVEANQAWREVERVSSEIADKALRAIASQISLPQPPQPNALPIVVFNSLNWQRSEVVTVPLPPSASSGEIYDLEGKQLVSQSVRSAMDSAAINLLFLAIDVPAVGYRVFWLCSQEGVKPDNSMLSSEISSKSTRYEQSSISVPNSARVGNKVSLEPKDWILENELLRVVVDFQSGDLSSVFDKINLREILNKAGGNQLQAFQDSGQYWDAWNIDPNYAEHPLPPTHLKSIQWLDQGQVQQRLRVVRQLGKSEFCQDYILQVASPLLKIVTTADWQERHVLLKAAFPLNLEADYATYEIPCGAICRPTQPKTPTEQAKWEVPARHWGDLTQESLESNIKTSDSKFFSRSLNSHLQIPSYGVSLLNDCKYGYDSQPNQLRLTLLRSPSWPDPDSDIGRHEFTYALYPHSGSWRSALTVRRGYELNLPLKVRLCPPTKVQDSPILPPVARLLDLSAENLVLIAFKQSEDIPQQWILRCYECHGEEAQLNLQSDLGLTIAHQVDLLERSLPISETSPSDQTCKISPWKITSFIVKRYH